MIYLTRSRDADRFGAAPLTWQPTYKSYNRGVPGAVIVCVNGHVGNLDDHEITTDGYVRPSVVCPEDGCDWHEMIQLVEWEG